MVLWQTLGLGCLKIRVLSDCHMQESTIIMTNTCSTSTMYIPSIDIVQLEPSDNSILVLSDSNDGVCPTIDLSITSPLPFRSTHTMSSQFGANIEKYPFNPQYIKMGIFLLCFIASPFASFVMDNGLQYNRCI